MAEGLTDHELMRDDYLESWNNDPTRRLEVLLLERVFHDQLLAAGVHVSFLSSAATLIPIAETYL